MKMRNQNDSHKKKSSKTSKEKLPTAHEILAGPKKTGRLGTKQREDRKKKKVRCWRGKWKRSLGRGQSGVTGM